MARRSTPAQIDAGASAFLPKPEGIYDLTRTVSDLLGAAPA